MSKKTEDLLKAINSIAKAEQDDLEENIKDFPEVNTLLDAVESYEKKIAKLLREQKNFFIKQFKSAVTKNDNPLIGAFLEMIFSDIIELDTFRDKLTAEAKKFLEFTVPQLTSAIMNSIDRDIQFNILSNRTLSWIDEWAEELGSIMNLTSHKKVQELLDKGVSEGWGIDKIVQELKDAPEFDRKRARATAVTEVLTASSVSQLEAYRQSPSVEGKTWRHSGAKKNTPRPHHVALDGTTINLDDKFDVGGYEADHPRDTELPAKERVFCHCVLSPSVNQDILRLSKEEKELIRARVLAEL